MSKKYNNYKTGEGKIRINNCIKDYINGNISQHECCKKYGITINVFRYHYKNGNNNNFDNIENNDIKQEVIRQEKIINISDNKHSTKGKKTNIKVEKIHNTTKDKSTDKGKERNKPEDYINKGHSKFMKE